ncbi:hypothetical protein MPTK1_6g15000 [Marchantia polymorpha subsp. ruderalis]|uniref:Uncharacterized protein n=2 Tax=Marchantia polymorpha TaxID=3197 RepID=A0AAF6BS66_MARPO|nr:hypothetical protein MARPO_0056s0010 [Marchantia polymorpha]BBN14850.1 hypothetical protein Mp_6g15000 [Marchantia polymorpha subsp. ruderalis]|eukprot:PTQ37531.1 hypothetical protein MARPO_0056s0010 [Marchantia polymorpha]
MTLGLCEADCRKVGNRESVFPSYKQAYTKTFTGHCRMRSQGGVASAAISYDGEQQHPYPATRLEFMTKTHQSGSPQCF